MFYVQEFERNYGDIIRNIVRTELRNMGIVTSSAVIVMAINGTNITVRFPNDPVDNTFIVKNVTGQTLTVGSVVRLIEFDSSSNSIIGFNT